MADLGKSPPASEITPGILGDRSAPVPEELGSLRGDRGGSRRRPRLAFPLGARPPSGIGRRRGASHRAPAKVPGPYDTTEPRTPYADVTTYNNFYEFGTSKDDPARESGALRRPPVDGRDRRRGPPRRRSSTSTTSCGRFPLEERVYRMRCVEAWSMVIPWAGLPALGAPRARRAHVEREVRRVQDAARSGAHARTAHARPRLAVRRGPAPRRGDASADAARRRPLRPRAAEPQNGAPVRLVVPWKYGFKGIKSIVKIELTDEQPRTTWNAGGPGRVRLLRQRESRPSTIRAGARRPSGASARSRRRPTLPFNGYAEQVASLYSGMDLRRNF